MTRRKRRRIRKRGRIEAQTYHDVVQHDAQELFVGGNILENIGVSRQIDQDSQDVLSDFLVFRNLSVSAPRKLIDAWNRGSLPDDRE